MLSPRSITILALVVAAAAHPALLPPVFKRPDTSLSKSELEDVQPWIKFPFFGNVLESFPHFLPTIPEAGPKIENDSQKFQVIINVKEYNKKESFKVQTKGSFIIIQGAHADIHDSQSSIDSQFIQTYTLPLKVVQSSVTATLTSDGYLVITAPIGSAINDITYNEKEIPIVESGLPLLEENIEDKNVVSSTSTPLILVTPSIELLPPKRTNDEAVNVGYLTPTIPAVSLSPPQPTSEENIQALIPTVPTIELLPPKQSNDGDVNEPIVIPVPSGQFENNGAANTNNENVDKVPDKEVAIPTIISIPLQQQTEGHLIIVGPTYAPISKIQESSQSVLTNDATQSEENIDTPITEIISSFNEPLQGSVSINQSAQIIATSEQALLYKINDIYTSNPLQYQDNNEPTYAPISKIQESSQSVLTNDATQSVQNVDTPTTEIISLINEQLQGSVTINQSAQKIATTEQASLYTINDIYASTPLQYQKNKSEDITEKSEMIQLRNEGFNDFTTEISSLQESGPVDNDNVLRSDIVSEQESYTGEPEIIKAEEILNEEGSFKDLIAPESLSQATATAEAANIVAPTTEQQELLHKDDESELIVESSTASLVRSDLNQNEEINDSQTEINNIPDEFARSQENQNIIGTENVVEDSTLSENLPISDVVEVTDTTIPGESLASITNVVYNEELLMNVPQTEVEECEPIISPDNVTNKTSEVSDN